MTTYGPFAFATATTDGSDDFLYDSPLQTAATLPAAANADQNVCWNTGSAPSGNVGPEEGQQSDGYIYSETSAPGANGDVYSMEFDTTLDASAEQWQFNFYSMQRGPAIGNNQSTMTVQINENAGGWVDVSGQLGGSGNDTTDGTTTGWTSQSIDLSESGVNTDSLTRVRIRWVSQAGTTWHADIAIDTVEIVGTPLAAVEREQDSFAFEEDDGSESGSSIKTQNLDLTRGKENPFRLRQGTQYIDDPDAEAVEVEYKENGDPASEWRSVQ